ncbi:hypothetical protein QPL79_05605 [Ignisphaera sp. 4213-co]|uniref:HEPN domain-containing protein n=1 Tax=Ignisphaera cupida TaxID=3050454 RepID=A0ABD4Z809_9CREN|nr:hypothetical protein [Ignisphaera sp. 4213-co]MDK6028834.1 hypothetical protein [Ignisphaera sp. 4213-co]
MRRRVIYNHGPELIGIFVEVFESEWVGEFDVVVNALEYLTEYYTRSRYPFLMLERFWGPEDVIDAEKALEVVRNYLKRRAVIDC